MIALFMTVFALGSLPLLALTQNGIGWLRARLGTRGVAIAVRGAMAAAATIIEMIIRSHRDGGADVRVALVVQNLEVVVTVVEDAVGTTLDRERR